MSPIEYKYISLVSSRLELFKLVSERGIYNFRCPFCGDSKKKKTKARGYLFQTNELKTRFICHNCSTSLSFSNFLKNIDSQLFMEYRIENFSKRYHTDIIKTTQKYKKRISSNNLQFNIIKQLKRLDDTNTYTQKEKEIFEYVNKRMIPKKFHNSLYMCTNINNLIKQIPRYHRTTELNKELYGLVIPFFDKEKHFNYLQIRFINTKDSNFRYLTIEIEESDEYKIWGIEYINWNDPIYILEGPIDAMFINNSLAIAGAINSTVFDYIKTKAKNEIIFCYDNEVKTNKTIKKQIENRIEEGYSVVIYDSSFKWKDINEAIMSNEISVDILNEYLKSHTYKSLKAKLHMSKLNY